MNKITGLLVTLVIAIIAFSVGIIAIGFYLSPQDPLSPADAIVVISGGETFTRTTRGIDLYLDGYAPLLIFSGDALDPDSISNAEAMEKIALEEYDIPAGNIITEKASTSTYENAINLQSVFTKLDINSIILVTSPYHQRRSKMTFQHVMGPDFTIINQSATDEFWRKIAWWQNDRAVYLTLSELWKIIYIDVTGEYQ
ncbi:MAG: YdcF family protein [Patescibacteria group bacterium]